MSGIGIENGPQRRFKPYPAYSDSGVEWLGEIPAHWVPLSLSRVTVSRCDGPFGSGLKSEHYAASGVRVVRLQNIGWAEFSGSDEAYVDENYARSLGNHTVVSGDLLVAGLGDEGHPVGRACVAPNGIEPSMVKADCFRFRLDRRRILPAFAAYQLSVTAAAAAGSLATGATRSRMNLGIAASRKVALPPIDEQRIVAAFLDRETARIDELVGKKERLIELLQEKRTALITRAVTEGLDPNVPMKDSGAEWLSEIPAHWCALRFKRLFKDIYRYPTYYDIEYVPEGVPEVRGEALVDGRIIVLPDQRYISAETNRKFERTILQEGDLVMSVRGTMGKIGLVLPDSAGANITANLLRLSPREDVASGHYLSWLMRSALFLKLLDRQSPQTTIQTITMPQLAIIVVPIPGLGEQRAIAVFLDRETTRIDGLVAKVRDAIDRLKELRTALISAAVTGKIDVREASGSG